MRLIDQAKACMTLISNHEKVDVAWKCISERLWKCLVGRYGGCFEERYKELMVTERICNTPKIGLSIFVLLFLPTFPSQKICPGYRLMTRKIQTILDLAT